MKIKSVRRLVQFSLIGLFVVQGAAAEEPAATATAPDASGQMGGMQHSMGGANTGQPSDKAMGGMQHGGMGGGMMGGMQHGGTGAEAQGGMGGMQHGGMGGGMMGGMGAMTEQQQEEAWKQLQAQDIRLGELRRQIREATDQSVRDKLKTEHRSVLKEQLMLTHKLMMAEHMKGMMGAQKPGGQAAPPTSP